MSYVVLFAVCFYASTCIGIYMKSRNVAGYSVRIKWIAVFPFLYLYAFVVLLRAKTFRLLELLSLFRNRISFFLLLKAVKATEQARQTQVCESEKATLTQNIQSLFCKEILHR